MEADLRRLGVRAGDTLLVHASLSSLGWVCGGATTVVHALLDLLGPTGTLVAPAQTPENRDPSTWHDPPVPESWWPDIRDHLPGFDPLVTPSGRVGVVPERVRTWPAAVRSVHPQTSFAAVGRDATVLLDGHALESPLGESSPLARLEQAQARVLLLGVGYDRCTAFHLAEYRLPGPPIRVNACAVMTPAGRRWVEYSAVALDARDFAGLGAAFERRTGLVSVGQVGQAVARLLPLPAAVEFALGWLMSPRPGGQNRTPVADSAGGSARVG